MVGDGGAAKYDLAIEKEVARLLALSNKVALVAVKVVGQHVQTHGRPSSTDLDAFKSLRTRVEEEVPSLGLSEQLDHARMEYAKRRHCLASRRNASVHSRNSRLTVP